MPLLIFIFSTRNFTSVNKLEYHLHNGFFLWICNFLFSIIYYLSFILWFKKICQEITICRNTWEIRMNIQGPFPQWISKEHILLMNVMCHEYYKKNYTRRFVISFIPLSLFLFFPIFKNWSIVDLQYCVSFRYTIECYTDLYILYRYNIYVYILFHILF